MGQTIAEKIFSQHVGKKIYAGDFAIAKLDLVMVTTQLAPGQLTRFTKLLKKFGIKRKFLYLLIMLFLLLTFK